MPRPIFATPDDAERAFYEALSQGNLEAMLKVWSEDEEVFCVLPSGPRITGFPNVREAWRQLFASGLKIQVRTQHLVKSQAMLLAVHSLIEHIDIEGENPTPQLIATNVYSRGAQGWQMIGHHTSPSPESDSLQITEGPRVVH